MCLRSLVFYGPGYFFIFLAYRTQFSALQDPLMPKLLLHFPIPHGAMSTILFYDPSAWWSNELHASWATSKQTSSDAVFPCSFPAVIIPLTGWVAQTSGDPKIDFLRAWFLFPSIWRLSMLSCRPWRSRTINEFIDAKLATLFWRNFEQAWIDRPEWNQNQMFIESPCFDTRRSTNSLFLKQQICTFLTPPSRWRNMDSTVGSSDHMCICW